MSKKIHAGDNAIATLALSPGKEYVETPAVKALSQRALSYLQAGFAVHLRGPAESSTALNSTPISGTTYYDENVKAGTTYYYVLKGVGPSDTALSAPSNETVVTIP